VTTLCSPFSAGFTTSAADDLAATIKVLAVPNRLKILALLHANGPLAVHQITDRLGTVAQPTVSHHVGILTAAGLIVKQRTGVEVTCALAGGRMAAIAHLLDPGGEA
jgi:ArsR family transcriptional regulator